jgi:hypothetical protein
MDAETSMKMLIYLRRYWNSHSKKKIDIHSWSPIIDTLIYKISRDALTKTQFRKCFSHLLYTEKAKTVQQQNRRRQAKSWLANQPERYLLVKETFRYLDYSSLEDFCESRGGFVHGETPNPMQEHGFLILEKLTASVFPGFFVLSDGFPERRIIQNANAVYHGMAVCQRRAKPILNSMGSLLAKRNISAIYLKYTVFQPHLFFDALSTYIHEICHMFGSDSSQAFSLALTLSTEILLKNYSAVVLAEKQWISVMSEKSQVQLYDR